ALPVDARAENDRAREVLRLREVEERLVLDAVSRDVIRDRVAPDLSSRGHDRGELGLDARRDDDSRRALALEADRVGEIAPEPHEAVRSDEVLGRGPLDEELRPLAAVLHGLVDVRVVMAPAFR